jgi:hypothetical protein
MTWTGQDKFDLKSLDVWAMGCVLLITMCSNAGQVFQPACLTDVVRNMVTIMPIYMKVWFEPPDKRWFAPPWCSQTGDWSHCLGIRRNIIGVRRHIFEEWTATVKWLGGALDFNPQTRMQAADLHRVALEDRGLCGACHVVS